VLKEKCFRRTTSASFSSAWAAFMAQSITNRLFVYQKYDDFKSQNNKLARTMDVKLNANTQDSDTGRVREVLYDVFHVVAKDLSKDYGGTIQHLWIDFELIQEWADRRPPFPFRLQKRASGALITKLTGMPAPVYEHVGHYSVRPDFKRLLGLPLESVPRYALSLIYASTSVLHEKRKKLGGFDASRFRMDFLTSCRQHGYEIDYEDAGSKRWSQRRLRRSVFAAGSG
jgi:hypothetical protein